MNGRAVALVVLGVATACDGGGSTAVTSATSTAAPTTTSAVTLPPTTVAPTTALATTTAAPQLDVGLLLDGTDWQLDAVIRSEDAEAVPRDVPDPTIAFDDGIVTVDTGCNIVSGAFTTSGDQITFEPLTLSEQECGGALANVARSMAHVLQDTATVRFDNGILNILRDGEQLVYFPS